MKKIGVSVLAVLLLLFLASSIQAQNQSADNSNVITYNYWWDWTDIIDCPTTGTIYFSGSVHQIYKSFANGTLTAHFNAYGEGIDESGGVWIWHDAWNQFIPADYPDDYHQTRNLTLQGPQGAKLKLKSMWLIRDGEIINSIFDPICD